jgi:hypothetical protein
VRGCEATCSVMSLRDSDDERSPEISRGVHNRQNVSGSACIQELHTTHMVRWNAGVAKLDRQLTPCIADDLEKLKLDQYLKRFPSFMKGQGSLLYSK